MLSETTNKQDHTKSTSKEKLSEETGDICRKTNEDIENKQEQFNSNTHAFDEDELFDHNQQHDNYINKERINQQNYMDNDTTALTARSGRQVKRPSTFDDFVCNYS
jgi:hypothetical protein